MGVKPVLSQWKSVWQFLREMRIELPQDPAVPILGKVFSLFHYLCIVIVVKRHRMSKTAQIGNNTGIKCSMKSLYPGHLWEMCHLVSSLCLEHMGLLLHILFVTDPSAVTWCVIALKHKVPGHTGNINTFVLAKSKSVLYLEGKKKKSQICWA